MNTGYIPFLKYNIIFKNIHDKDIKCLQKIFPQFRTELSGRPDKGLSVYCNGTHQPGHKSKRVTVRFSEISGEYTISDIHDNTEIACHTSSYLKFKKNISLNYFKQSISFFLQYFVEHTLSGISLHTAGLTLNGRCICFCGDNNSGKTTISLKLKSLCRNSKIESDDIMYLFPENNKIFAVSNPLFEQSSKPVQLYNILFLSPDKTCNHPQLTKLSDLKSVVYFLKNITYNNFYTDKTKQLLGNSTKLAELIPLKFLYRYCQNGCYKHIYDLKKTFDFR